MKASPVAATSACSSAPSSFITVPSFIYIGDCSLYKVIIEDEATSSLPLNSLNDVRKAKVATTVSIGSGVHTEEINCIHSLSPSDTFITGGCDGIVCHWKGYASSPLSSLSLDDTTTSTIKLEQIDGIVTSCWHGKTQEKGIEVTIAGR